MFSLVPWDLHLRLLHMTGKVLHSLTHLGSCHVNGGRTVGRGNSGHYPAHLRNRKRGTLAGARDQERVVRGEVMRSSTESDCGVLFTLNKVGEPLHDFSEESCGLIYILRSLWLLCKEWATEEKMWSRDKLEAVQ